MKLIDIKTFRTRIGEMDVNDINVLLGSALDMVTTPIEGLLNTRFANGQFQDIYMPAPINPAVAVRPYQVALSSGLVATEPPLEVKAAYQYADLASIEAIPVAYIVDYEHGHITFPLGRPNAYLSISYTSGLPAVESGDDYDTDSIPMWLQNVTIAYAHAVYQRMIWVRAKGSKEQAKSSRPLGDILVKAPADIATLAQQYIRWFPTAVSPTTTSRVV